MKLVDALELAWLCGLETVEEAILNVELHWVYGPGELPVQELAELYQDAAGHNLQALVVDLLPQEQRDQLDAELEQALA